MFFALEGPDGAGKTTLAKAVTALLPDRGVIHVGRRQVSTTSAYAASLMAPLVDILWHSGDSPDLSDSFWAHTQAAWFTAHGEQVVRPAVEHGGVVLVDGWYYKLRAQLLEQGYAPDELDALFARVPIPDHVVVLAVDPATLWARRSHALRPAELGMHGTYPELGEQSFLAYQQRGLDNLLAMAAQHGWTVLDVPADEPETDTARRVADVLSAHLDTPTTPTVATYTWPHVDQSLKRAVAAQLGRSLSDWDASGVIGEYEDAFAQFVGTRHAIAFSSGTAALHAMCVAAGLGEGDELIAPAYTFAATASPFAYEGVRVRFADADAHGNLNPAELDRLLTDDTRAVIVTHMWGNPCNMDLIAGFCAEQDLLLLEDCSHAHFASWRGQRVGTFGAMAAFSTNQKAITTGEGGVLVTNDPAYRDLALLHGHYNKRCFREINPSQPYHPYALTGMGLKTRATTLGAAIGLDQLAKADTIEARRREVLAAYTDALAGNPVVSPIVVDPAKGTHGLYVMGLRYHAEAATVPIEEFVDQLTATGADFDMPGSTRIIADEPLFHRPHRDASWNTVHPMPAASYPGAETFTGSFIKTPLWGYPGDGPAVDQHITTLVHLSKQVAR